LRDRINIQFFKAIKCVGLKSACVFRMQILLIADY